VSCGVARGHFDLVIAWGAVNSALFFPKYIDFTGNINFGGASMRSGKSAKGGGGILFQRGFRKIRKEAPL
jgi:hypothetical protein